MNIISCSQSYLLSFLSRLVFILWNFDLLFIVCISLELNYFKGRFINSLIGCLGFMPSLLLVVG